ncbi:MAG: hypothetical protein AAFN93_27805, partial [Bacteroidota bacterium]
MIDHKDYSTKFEEAVNCLRAGDFHKSIELVREMLLESPTHPELMMSCPGILIDAGNIIGDINSIQLGTSLLEKVLSDIKLDDHQIIGELEYNLSNAYSAQAELLQKNGEVFSHKELIQKQKQVLQSVLLKKEKLDTELLCKAICNYGNLLCSLGRVAESIDYLYDCLNIDPKHAVAMCNCSSALQKIINLSYKHNHRVCYEFWRLMNEASQLPNEMAELAGVQMYKDCLHSLEGIEVYIKTLNYEGIEGLKNNIVTFDEAHTWRPGKSLRKIEEDRLFLTVNPRLANCVEHYKDDLCFETMVSPFSSSGVTI